MISTHVKGTGLRATGAMAKGKTMKDQEAFARLEGGYAGIDTRGHLYDAPAVLWRASSS